MAGNQQGGQGGSGGGFTPDVPIGTFDRYIDQLRPFVEQQGIQYLNLLEKDLHRLYQQTWGINTPATAMSGQGGATGKT